MICPIEIENLMAVDRGRTRCSREMIQGIFGELTAWGRDGKIRGKGTIGGDYPCPPRGTEH